MLGFGLLRVVYVALAGEKSADDSTIVRKPYVASSSTMPYAMDVYDHVLRHWQSEKRREERDDSEAGGSRCAKSIAKPNEARSSKLVGPISNSMLFV